ncbi:hypothetical protein KIF24_02015 [Micromonospora sp. Llam7]|uniref:hypothetical protein n=1 Tax=Micromonospora tarapacensis TaxID=2835305 RepID=UPI001C82A160|nr:hypothetical protein [Micromonospora tarapacensis]MBX7264950.1 hypothetical protein [Micromonospora tarapacensis]
MTLEHPDWCRPALCDAEVPSLPATGGVHRGVPERLVLVLPMGDAISVTAQLQLPGHVSVDDVDRAACLAVQVAGGPLTLLPLDQGRLVVERLAPLLGLTVTASGV